MKENVQAHQGQVTFLRVSNSFIESPDNLASRDHLVSCGTDCTVRIWQLIRPEINRVSIQQVALVKLLQSPRDLAMAGNTLCMAMADNNVIMCRLIFSFFFLCWETEYSLLFSFVECKASFTPTFTVFRLFWTIQRSYSGNGGLCIIWIKKISLYIKQI